MASPRSARLRRAMLRRAALCLLASLALAAPAARAGGFGFGLSNWPAYAGGARPSSGGGDPADASHVLRVCADPDNLPYSNRDGSGFENRIAALVAHSLKARLEYVWTAPSRGYVRETLGADACDLLVGVPVGLSSALTTRPYYRSSYVFVAPARDAAPLRGAGEDPSGAPRVGVLHAAPGEAVTATPPGQTLLRAGADYELIDYAPPHRGDAVAGVPMLDALGTGALDAALLWGPRAGWLVARSTLPLRIERIEPNDDIGNALEASIAMGVRRGHEVLRAALDRVLEARRDDIDAILAGYHVPRVDQATQLVDRR